MIKRLWQVSPELIATTVLMLVVLAGAIAGLLVDPRLITGAPAWLKPAKFAVSIALYTATLAWLFTLLPEWRRTRRIVGWATAAAMVTEMLIIGAQAWRGTTSHFNVATAFDGALFIVMGLAIVAQTVLSAAVAAALWKQRFGDAALGWAVRLGLTLTIVGAFTGGFMTRPTGPQLAAARAGARMTIAGAHRRGRAASVGDVRLRAGAIGRSAQHRACRRVHGRQRSTLVGAPAPRRTRRAVPGDREPVRRSLRVSPRLPDARHVRPSRRHLPGAIALGACRLPDEGPPGVGARQATTSRGQREGRLSETGPSRAP